MKRPKNQKICGNTIAAHKRHFLYKDEVLKMHENARLKEVPALSVDLRSGWQYIIMFESIEPPKTNKNIDRPKRKRPKRRDGDSDWDDTDILF